ncbi:hypothetical protein [Brevundimonas naejangsanensis]|uniref:hypothetical protein n=1 Tax=Brevundimonas naejangsanensis TaxID=588932 RepID=UPI0026EB1777|nr:hypothetical protein [Brevundimonas naejangsanensis]
MTHATIRTDLQDGILLVTLAREARLKAFTPEMADDSKRCFGRSCPPSAPMAQI